jgi:hypothetical protein
MSDLDKKETVYAFGVALEDLHEQIKGLGSVKATAMISALQSDLAAYRNSQLHLAKALERELGRTAEVEKKLAEEKDKCTHWFRESNQHETECIDLQTEIRKLKAERAGKAKGKKVK